MTNKKHIFSIIFIGSLLTGCATGPSPTGIGLYTDVKGPITATSLPATKTGKACAQTVLGIVPRFYVSTSKSIIKALINMHSFEIQLSPIG